MADIIRIDRPKLPLAWTGERYTTGANEQVEIEHYHRYLLARSLCNGLDVLDAACGEGYGTALLAQTARSATGVDISKQAVEFAARNYCRPNLQYCQCDIQILALEAASLDAIVSFETIEHIQEQEAFIQACKSALRPDGFLLISSPDEEHYNSGEHEEPNPYHVRELTRTAFTALLRDNFSSVQFLTQIPMVGSLIAGDETLYGATFERTALDTVEVSAQPNRAPYILALASNVHQERLPSSSYIHRRSVEDGAEGHIASQLAVVAAAVQKLRTEVYQNAERAALHLIHEKLTDSGPIAGVYQDLRRVMDAVSQFSMSENGLASAKPEDS